MLARTEHRAIFAVSSPAHLGFATSGRQANRDEFENLRERQVPGLRAFRLHSGQALRFLPVRPAGHAGKLEDGTGAHGAQRGGTAD